ncbi:MAG: adenosylcobinamide amidohydrolase [Gemmobacter sp.]|nr:adenosylcobinamide amidohydrolase [Gemmobacter sp.]
MISVALDRPWLRARLPHPMRVLSWAPVNPGYQITDQILWREVRNADLTPDFDAIRWFADQIAGQAPGAVGLLTSRDVGTWVEARARVQGITAHAIATVGLSNAESVGTRLPYHPADYGTINVAVAVDVGLSEIAQLEALSIAVQARTAAVMAGGMTLATGVATGTGTDCLALACNVGDGCFAGLHTAVGEAVGAATRNAVATGVSNWQAWFHAEMRHRGLA